MVLFCERPLFSVLWHLKYKMKEKSERAVENEQKNYYLARVLKVFSKVIYINTTWWNKNPIAKYGIRSATHLMHSGVKHEQLAWAFSYGTKREAVVSKVAFMEEKGRKGEKKYSFFPMVDGISNAWRDVSK